MDSKVCVQCGESFRSKWRMKEQKYCDAECYKAARAPQPKECEHCHNLFTGRAHVNRKSRFCTRDCASAARYANYVRREYARAPDDLKPCGNCRELKPPSDFGADKSRLDGLFPYCSECAAELASKQHQRVRSTEKGRRRKRRNGWLTVLKSYGITELDYLAMLERQEGVCAICKQPETHKNSDGVRPLAVDHDHRTGRVRGLLCHRCNLAIGYFKDDPERLMAARDYLLEGIEHCLNRS